MKRVLRLIPTLLLAAVFMLLFASQTACDGSIAPLRLSSLQTAAARTLYVATTGHDADPGTLSQPWRTIQHAADAVQPGDTVFVRSGTYAESVTVARSGAQNNPITFSAYSGEAVTLDGSGSEWAGFIVDQGVSNVVLDGFAVRNYSEVSVDVRGTNSYITLSNLDLSGASGGVRITWGYSGEAPMYGPADHITIRDSRIHDNHLSGIDATPGPATDLVFQRLTVENNGVGVQSFGADGIAVERGYPVLVEDVTIRNNGGDGQGG
ncbi:MAG: right-handed parallel beta-helix repeat-containing protein, partial [Chloroflexi bacterium]|nr:right-handed parallel beta-helix repeat-containing protein [Chloroflexota bacterium]